MLKIAVLKELNTFDKLGKAKLSTGKLDK